MYRTPIMGKKHKFVIIILIIIAAVAVTYGIIYIFPSQRLSEFEQNQYSVRYYDRNGKLLRWTPAADGSWQTKVTLSQVPPEIIRSILRAEDRRFYWHCGTDIPAVIRGFFQNVTGSKLVDHLLPVFFFHAHQMQLLICRIRRKTLID